MNVNIKNTKCCVLCKNWYDLNNSMISPQNPKSGVWKIKKEGKRMCLLKNYDMPAMGHCLKYVCKFDV